jgi:hypothetical protein
MLLPETEREALTAVMDQAEKDLSSAHAAICEAQGLDTKTNNYTWPDWTPQAQTLRWFAAIRQKFNL